jgi:peptide-methionine (S)-S-oxide reductase
MFNKKALTTGFVMVVAGFLASWLLTTMNPANSAETSSPTNTKASAKLERALFSEGCFWKVQYLFSKLPGVVKTTVGYSGGNVANPSYKMVCTDTTGHAETCLVEYDPTKISYHKLLETFFTTHNPTTKNSQGPDFGSQYRSVIFYSTPEQQKEALQMKEELTKEHKFNSPIVTEIEPAKPFYSAEDYHQNYFQKTGRVCF